MKFYIISNGVPTGETNEDMGTVTVKKTAELEAAYAVYQAGIQIIHSEVAGPDYIALDAACVRFRALCAAIDALLPEALRPFRGGYDEIAAAEQYATTMEALTLEVKLLAANAACNYEAGKVDMQSPRWWYHCWGLQIPG